MPDITADGKTRVAWVPSIANINAPTTTELNAGMLLHSTLTADGLVGLRPETADVDTSSLDSTFSTTVNGRTSFSGTMLRLKKQSGTDTIFDTLVRDAVGFLVVRRSVAASTAWASAQKVEVYPALCGEVARVDPEPNTVERYEIPLKITSSPSLRAAVA
ncbi:hypothetical protein [Micromonospora aurantiaca]|uniref:Uncharacterized protein n=1 Tax=Micromonospora aurantiaca (nom. illeg.) TaxID=47850 RepID=A0A6N3JV23_9ACTN|nr:hypothetical protein [Micromonospora aurantiaca]AXH89401.1 hypothetical protein DVH21_05315 [Micromonospora aurantiaca]